MLVVEHIPRRTSKEANLVREEFQQCFVEEASVHWQNVTAGINEHT